MCYLSHYMCLLVVNPLGQGGEIMPGMLNIRIALAVVAAFLAAVAIAAAAMGATSATGASQLRGTGAMGYTPMSLFRC